MLIRAEVGTVVKLAKQVKPVQETCDKGAGMVWKNILLQEGYSNAIMTEASVASLSCK